MIRTRGWLVLGGAMAALSSVGCRKSPVIQAHDEPLQRASFVVPASADVDIRSAERAAHAALSEFRAALTRADQGAQNFELEAYVVQGANGERLWLNDVHAEPDGFEGALRSPPAVLTSLQRGQVLHVKDTQIVDWAFEERGQRRGGETRRIAARRQREAALKDALPKCADPHFADGCASLAESYANGSVGEVRPDIAYQLNVKSCAGGSAYGCNASGWASLHGRGTAQDLPAAAEFFARACPTGNEHPFACDSRGFALLSGLAGSTRDTHLAARLLTKPCARGLGQSCLLLELLHAKHLFSGPKVALACDVSISEQVSRCASDKDPEACFLAGSAFDTGVCNAPRSAARAAQFYAGAAEFGAAWPSAGSPR